MAKKYTQWCLMFTNVHHDATFDEKANVSKALVYILDGINNRHRSNDDSLYFKYI